MKPTSLRVSGARAFVCALLLLLLGSVAARAQGSRYDYVIQTTSVCQIGTFCPVLAVPGAAIRVCNTPNCASPASTYTTASLGTPCGVNAPIVLQGTTACVSNTDQYGNFGFWMSPGTYNYYVTFPANLGGATYGPFAFTVGTSSGSSGLNQLTGDVTAGPGTGSQAATLATVNGSPGSCGDSTHVSQVTVNGKGLTTACTAILITNASAITALTGDATASGPGSAALTFATVNANVGACGDATHVSQITLNAKGLATACTPVAISGGGSGTVGYINCTVTVTTTTLTIASGATSASPCNLNTGIVTLQITGAVTAVLSGTSGNGAGWVYLSSAQILTVAWNTSTSTVTCTGCSTQSGVTSLPANSLPIAAISWTANSWSTPNILLGPGHTVLNCGTGVSCPQDAITGAYAVTADTSTQRFVDLGNLTDGATVTFASGTSYLTADAYLTFTTHGGTRTLNVSGLVDGGQYWMYLKQDGTGGENLTGGTGCTWIVVGGAGSGAFPTLTSAANAVDLMTFTYNLANTTCTAVFGLNAK